LKNDPLIIETHWLDRVKFDEGNQSGTPTNLLKKHLFSNYGDESTQLLQKEYKNTKDFAQIHQKRKTIANTISTVPIDTVVVSNRQVNLFTDVDSSTL